MNLLDKAFGLSLSDQYWLKPYNLDIKYDDINFFDNDFEYSEFLEASLSKNSKIITNENSLKTPNIVKNSERLHLYWNSYARKNKFIDNLSF